MCLFSKIFTSYTTININLISSLIRILCTFSCVFLAAGDVYISFISAYLGTIFLFKALFIKINVGATFQDFDPGCSILEDGTCLTYYKLYRSHTVVLSIQLVKQSRHTQQLTLKFTQLSATSF